MPCPFVIATSSIALQQAILDEYIPFLAETLVESGIIESPFGGQLRKGKEHYVCRYRLRERIRTANLHRKNPLRKEALLRLQVQADADKAPNLSPFDRRKICVLGRHEKTGQMYVLDG